MQNANQPGQFKRAADAGISIGFAILMVIIATQATLSRSPSAELGSNTDDSAQFGKNGLRLNSHPAAQPILVWDLESRRNVKWKVDLGSVTHGTPVVANGKVFISTNNAHAYLDRYPDTEDRGVLLCFRESNGEFLWQYSCEKLGRSSDTPRSGICSTPIVEGNRLWVVNNRGEVVCIDVDSDADEPEVLWRFSMRDQLGSRQHSAACCSPTIWGDVLFAQTSNGVDQAHRDLPAPKAASFVALDKNSGEVLWTDDSPGENILHGQWSSPAVGMIDDVPQVLFAGGDGWLYSFRADEWNADGTPIPLWWFDGNPKNSVWNLGGRGTRNNIVATPVIHNGLVYLAMGQEPEHGMGPANLWCIDPTGRGDRSSKLVVDEFGNPAPRRREVAIDEESERVTPNPNSGVVWNYASQDNNDDGKIDDLDETLHRTMSSPVIVDDVLIIPDSSGFVHCLDAKSGQVHWVADLFGEIWGSPLAIGNRVYIADEYGDVSIFVASPDPSESVERRGTNQMDHYEPRHKVVGRGSISSMPAFANGVLYLPARSELFAVQTEE